MRNFVFFILLMLFFQGCKPSEKQDIPNFYGMEFNPEREDMGLPILPDNWRKRIFNRREIYQISWINPDRNLPRYSKKSIQFNKDTMIWESNEYIGSKKFIEVDITRNEQLFIIYHFVQNELGKVGFRYSLTTGVVGNCFGKIEPHACNYMDNFQITKEAADSILTSWGLLDKSIGEHKLLKDRLDDLVESENDNNIKKVEKRSLIKSVKEFVKRKMPKFVIDFFKSKK